MPTCAYRYLDVDAVGDLRRFLGLAPRVVDLQNVVFKSMAPRSGTWSAILGALHGLPKAGYVYRPNSRYTYLSILV